MFKSRLIDVPVQKSEDESLGVSMYADILYRFIMSCETPITIGIQGDWGIGKTSLLNLVKELLAPTRGRQAKYHVIYFNTWQYSQFNQEQFLGLSILKGIIAEIQNLDTLKSLRQNETVKNAINKFGNFVSQLGNQVVKKQTGIDIQKALENEKEAGLLDDDIIMQIRKMKDEFQSLVHVLIPNDQDRLVIMIDDLDRIKPVKALELLESIKNFLDVESCVFVIAVDYSVIQTGMVEKLGRSTQELQGKSYFDKIIQVPFSMPSNSYQIDKYIMSLLGWNYSADDDCYSPIEGKDRDQFFLKIRAKNISKEDVEFFTNITALTVGNNPRSIKRAVNYANLLRMVAQSKISDISREEGFRHEWDLRKAKRLYPLSCMQLAWPELFVHFSDEPTFSSLSLMQDFDYLQKLRGMGRLFKRVHNPEETMSNITGFIDEFITLIDIDGDGQISAEEFSPIREMMEAANLTTAKNKDLDEAWKDLRAIIDKNMGENADPVLVDKIFSLFRNDKSLWNVPGSFNLLGAGKKFFNITWCRKQVGSVVSTQKEPVQLYLKGEWTKYNESVKEDVSPFLIDVHAKGHYGTGDTRVEIVEIAKKNDGVNLMNSIFEAMESQLLK